MNELERRTVLSAAGIGALAAMSKAGPLSPPAGSVAPTGRTTDEIYNKISFGDGRIPIAASTTPITISQPGSYVLTGNIAVAANATAITIAASGVTLDLNGYSVTGSGNPSNGVVVATGTTRVVVRNGIISGVNAGVAIAPACASVVVEDLLIKETRLYGVLASSNDVRSVRISRCTINDAGMSSIPADGNIIITAISLTGGSHTIQDCVVSRMHYNGGGTPTFRAICLQSTTPNGVGNLVQRCFITEDNLNPGNGILYFGSGLYRDNTVIGFTTPYSGGVNGGGNV